MGGGYIAQFITNYQTWEATGGTLGCGTSPTFPSFAVIDCFAAVFQFPNGLYGVGICAAALLLLILVTMRMGNNDGSTYDRDRNFSYSNKGVYGTAGYMTQEEMSHVLMLEDVRHARGTILGELDGKVVCLPEDTRLNRNVAVFGASGSMKSRAYARNMALQCIRRGVSLILTDPKSELYEDLCEHAQRHGYTVRVLNLVHPEYSDSWACLREVDGDEIMAQVFADTVIKNTGGGKSDHFWDSGEMNLLKALILYVDNNYPEPARTLGEVYNLLTLNDDAALSKLFDMLPIAHPAKAPYSIFKKSGDSVRSGIIVGLGARLQLMQNQMIRNITSTPEIDLTLPGKEKCAYFLVTSDQDSTFDYLASLFFSFLFIKLVRYADQYGEGGKLPVPVHIIGDEWPNAAGTVVDFPKKISTIRSRDISISVIFQNLAQLENRYPFNQWQEILGNCDTHLFLGCTDPETAEFISKRTGETSVSVNGHSKQLNTWRVTDYTPQYRETSSIGKRRLMTMDEVLRFPLDEALVILRGQKVLRVKKFDYTKHPDSRKLVKCKACTHIPAWRSEAAPPQAVYTTTKPPLRHRKAEKLPKAPSGPRDKQPAPPPEQLDTAPPTTVPPAAEPTPALFTTVSIEDILQ